MSKKFAHLSGRFIADKYADYIKVGAGTICNLDELDKALSAGAKFIVTPVVNERVINVCVLNQIPIFVEAFTPTEIYKARSSGANMVKVLLTTKIGTSYIRNIEGPLNQIKLIPTGGINFENCPDFLRAGADGLGIGSQLFDKIHIREKKWQALRDNFIRFVRKIKSHKSETIRTLK